MEAQNKTLKGRTNVELRLRDAILLLQQYVKKSHLTELNARTSRWLDRHGRKPSQS